MSCHMMKLASVYVCVSKCLCVCVCGSVFCVCVGVCACIRKSALDFISSQSRIWTTSLVCALACVSLCVRERQRGERPGEKRKTEKGYMWLKQKDCMFHDAVIGLVTYFDTVGM